MKVLPKVIMVPFSYPDYPEDLVGRWVNKSYDMLKDLNIELTATHLVKERKDIPRVLEQIKKEDFDLIIALLVSWVEAPNFIATLRDFMDHPLLLWSHTTWEEKGERLTLGAVPAAGVIRETLEEMGVKFEFIWGMPGLDELKKKITSFSLVASTINKLKKARIGLFGYLSMGMYTGGFDHIKVRKILGPEIVHLGQYYIMKEFERISLKDAEKIAKELMRGWDIAKDVEEELAIKAIRVYLALKNLVKNHSLDALTVKCQYELSREWGFAPCIPLSILADDITSSCEGDTPLVISQLILHYLSGSPAGYGDVHDILPDNSILLGACGFAPLSFARGKPKIKKHTALYEGLLNSSPYREGEVTLCRIAQDKSGYKMHIATGQVEPPPYFHEVGCPPYAMGKIKLSGSAQDFFQNLMSQHYGIVYGNFKNELLTFCKMLGIRPVV